MHIAHICLRLINGIRGYTIVVYGVARECLPVCSHQRLQSYSPNASVNSTSLCTPPLQRRLG
jgi:hypothetical protein